MAEPNIANEKFVETFLFKIEDKGKVYHTEWLTNLIELNDMAGETNTVKMLNIRLSRLENYPKIDDISVLATMVLTTKNGIYTMYLNTKAPVHTHKTIVCDPENTERPRWSYITGVIEIFNSDIKSSELGRMHKK